MTTSSVARIEYLDTSSRYIPWEAWDASKCRCVTTNSTKCWSWCLPSLGVARFLAIYGNVNTEIVTWCASSENERLRLRMSNFVGWGTNISTNCPTQLYAVRGPVLLIGWRRTPVSNILYAHSDHCSLAFRNVELIISPSTGTFCPFVIRSNCHYPAESPRK